MTKYYYLISLLFLLNVLICPQQFTKTYTVGQTDLCTGSADKSSGVVRWTQEPMIFIGDNPGLGTGDYRGWIEFIFDNLPSNVVINKVQLQVYCAIASSSSLHRLMIRPFDHSGFNTT